MVLGKQQDEARPDTKRIALVARAHDLKTALTEGRVTSTDDYAAQENINPGDARRLVPLGSLAPDIVVAIIEGRQPVELTAFRLRRSNRLLMLWAEQRAFLGFAQNHVSC